jgi:ABC-type phosphate transport system substrate-binding protein
VVFVAGAGAGRLAGGHFAGAPFPVLHRSAPLGRLDRVRTDGRHHPAGLRRPVHLGDLRSVYARDGGPTNWRAFNGGSDLPIRLVSRTEGPGTRGILEEHVLKGPEPDLSSSDCERKDDLRAALHVIRCERSTQGQVLDTVNTVPGTIGYAEVHVASDARRYPNVRILALDGRMPMASPAMDRYPFVAPEVFYTYGLPPNDSPASAFLPRQ